jgi:hypothetical protein
MTLALVLHQPPTLAAAEIRGALRDAVWEVAEAHWTLGDESMIVACDLSADYLMSHFTRAMARRGFADPGLMLVVPLSPRSAWRGLPPEAAAWLRAGIE